MEGEIEEKVWTEPERPIAALLEVLRVSGFLGQADGSFTKLVDRAKEEYLALVRATKMRELAGRSRLYYHSDSLNGSDHDPSVEDRVQCKKEEANLVGSLCEDGLHRPVLDVDYGAQLSPSSTPGHHHLFFDTAMTAEKYFELLRVLSDAGILSVFFVKAAVVRGQSFVRVPWVRKTPAEVEASRDPG